MAKELQPKVVIAENVKGLLLGEAKKCVYRIHEEFDKAGYYCQHWLLDGQNMGVPQRRARVFFICLRKDIAAPFLHQEKSGYICGMSMPPVMMANIATRVYEEVLSKIKSDEDKD